MKLCKKLLAAFITIAMAVTMFASVFSASAAGFAASTLTPNQRKVYDQLVQTYVTDFSYGSSTSFSFWFKENFAFDETEAPVETADIFLAVSMFVADYAYALPWIDYEGQVMEEYPLPFVGASVNTMESIGVDLNLIIVMFSVKEEYQGSVGELFGYQNITISDPNPPVVETGNLAIGATITADSTMIDGNSGQVRNDLAPELANDGDYKSRWQSNTNASVETPCWLALDFGEPTTFDKIRLYWETARASESGFVIQYSDDGETWTDATFVSKVRTELNIDGNTEHQDDIVIEPVAAQYVRVLVTAFEKLGTVSIYEFEVYSGEITEPAPKATGIEVTKAPDKTTYYAGTYPYADLTGMELTVTYSDNSKVVMTAEELEAIRGYGSKDVFFAVVDDYSSSISISYLGFEASTPITLIDEVLVSEIEIVTQPTGEGLRGLVFNAYNADLTDFVELTIAEDAEPVQAINMMGIDVESYVVEYMGDDYLAIGLSYEGGGMLGGLLGGEEGSEDLGAILEEGFSIVTFMGCAASTLPIELPDITLTEDSTYTKDAEYRAIAGIAQDTTVAEFKTNFVEEIQLVDFEGNVLEDDAVVTDGLMILVLVEDEYVPSFYTTVIGEIVVPTLTLTDESTYVLVEDGSFVLGIAEDTTVAEFKTNFVEEIQLTDVDGNVYGDDEIVTSDMWIMVNVDGEYYDTYYTTVVEEDIEEPELTLTEESTYKLDTEELYVYGVSANTTVAEFKANFEGFVEVTDDEGNVYDDDALIGTGAWIMISVDGELIDTWYQPVISGDTNGDGKINSTDFMQIRRQFLGLYSTEDMAKNLAADANGDGNINSTDFMQVRRHFLGLFNLYA